MVSCGKCWQCLNTKSFIQKKACEYEALHHRYCFFVTPSYTEDNLPTVSYDSIRKSPSGACVCDLYDECPRSSTFGQYLGSVPAKQIEQVLKRRWNPIKHYQSELAYACTEDLQKFIKRLRMRIMRATGEKIRYFAVSDYGGKYLRPHFHILFYFDKQETFQVFSEHLLKSWQFGDVNYSLATGDCSSYVASYVTGTYRRYSLYKNTPFKVRIFHSKHLGFQALDSYRDEIYSSAEIPFNGHCYSLPNGLAEFYGTSSIERRFFPKIYGFHEVSPVLLLRLYTVYHRFGSKTGTYLAFRDLIMEYIGYGGCEANLLRLLLQVPSSYFDDSLLPAAQIDEKFESRLKSVYYVSKHFVNFVCQGDSAQFEPMLMKIVNYYDNNAWLKFTKFYTALELDNGFQTGLDSYKLLYPYTYLVDNYTFKQYKADFVNTDAYQRAKIESFNIYEQRIKHREHSDLITNGQI